MRKRIRYHWDVIGLIVLVCTAATAAEYLYNLPDITSWIVTSLTSLALGAFGYWPLSFE